MLKLEDLKVGTQTVGIVPDYVARIVSAEPAGSDAVTVIVKSDLGVAEQQLFRSDEARLSVAEKNLPWSFEAPADDFKLALEAFRIELGSAFDPMMAIHSSNVIPLPHQISAVYEKMLPQEPPIRADRHIEVKGRAKGATDVIMTCNEISYAVNQGDKFILALVLIDGDKTEGPYYIRNVWQNGLNFGVEHEAYKIADLMTKAEKPEETL